MVRDINANNNITDGTPNGTVLLKDLAAGSAVCSFA
jgi:ELWxxDGT repeat protein